MNHRSKEILLLAIENNNILFNKLPEIYNVSGRTIRNDINQINVFLSENDLGSIFIDKKVIKVDVDDKARVVESVNTLNPYEYKFSHEERSLTCLLILLDANDYVTMQTLSDKLFISRSTVIKDLKMVKKIAEENDIEIISKSNKGYKVRIDEENARIFLHKILNLDKSKTMEDVVFQGDFEEELKYKELSKLLSDSKVQLNISERELVECLEYLKISAYRNKKGFRIEKDIESNNERLSGLLENILLDRGKYPYINKNDIRFAANSISLKELKKYSQKNINHDYIRLQVASIQFIEKISNELNIDFSEDYIFYENFSNHIMRMLKKVDNSNKEEIFLEEVVERNKRIKDAIKRHLSILEKAIGRRASEVEVNYIIIHVYAALERKKKKGSKLKVALLTEYRVSQRLLIESRLKNNFSFKLDIFSMEDTLDVDNYDLVLTTANIENSNYLKISAFISDEDYIKIAKNIDIIVKKKERQDFSVDRELAFKFYDLVISEIDRFDFKESKQLKENIRKSILKHAENRIYDEDSEGLSEFLKEDRIKVDVKVNNWKEAIEAAGEILLNRGDIKREYLDAVIENAETNGFYFVISDGFALPHAGIDSYNLHTAMSLIRLKEPIYFYKEKEKRDVPGDFKTHPVQYFCLISATDKEKHLKAFFNLSNLLSNSEFKEELERAKTSKNIAEVIKDFEYLATSK